jgi:hypothetical protein
VAAKKKKFAGLSAKAITKGKMVMAPGRRGATGGSGRKVTGVGRVGTGSGQIKGKHLGKGGMATRKMKKS